MFNDIMFNDIMQMFSFCLNMNIGGLLVPYTLTNHNNKSVQLPYGFHYDHSAVGNQCGLHVHRLCKLCNRNFILRSMQLLLLHHWLSTSLG